MRSSRWLIVAIQTCLVIGLASCFYFSTRRGLGAWYFRKGTPDSLQAAIRWDPASPQYYDTLGAAEHLYADSANPNDIVQLYQNATSLSPHDAQFWSDLGAGYDWAGRSNDALNALVRARQLFPNSPEINWRLANFYIRAGNIPGGFDALRTVLETDATAGRKVFELVTNATRDKKAILDMLPHETPVFFDYINFQMGRGDILGAEETWARFLQLNLPFDLTQAFPYFDALIQHRQLIQMTETWLALSGRFPSQLKRLTAGSNLIHNGNIEFDVLNGGLDWRIVPVAGAVVSLESEGAPQGARAIQITFDGTQNLDYAHVFQFVPVSPNTRYHFSGYIRAKGITTDSGPRFEVRDAYNLANLLASTDGLLGTSGWLEQKGEFNTKPGTQLLLVRIARPASVKLDNQISGTVWVNQISLQAEP